jgi:acetoacetyl-CoA synthetase
MSGSKRLWEPSPQQAQASQMHAFMAAVAEKYGTVAEWEALRAWSLDHPAEFWSEMLAFAEIRPTRPAERVVSGSGMRGTRWFEGLELNYAAHLLRFDDDNDALMRAEVARCAAALRDAGVHAGRSRRRLHAERAGDDRRDAGRREPGAAWSSCSPDFGVRGVLDRFGQIEPKVLVTTDGYRTAGKRFDRLQVAARCCASCRASAGGGRAVPE